MSRKKLTPEQQTAANARQRKYRKLYPERWKEYRKRYYIKHKTAYIEYERDRRFRHDFGITAVQYDEMFEHQQGLCKICHKPETTKNTRGEIKKLAVDHDHVTGKVRSLLCAKCNQAIGLLDDSPDRLRAAALYLEEHNVGE